MTFLHPLILWALVTLPLIYWITRALPPPARRQVFPPIKILQSLVSPDHRAARSSYWLLLLRIAALAGIIIGFSRPVWLPQPGRQNLPDGDLTVIVDNGWAAFPNAEKIRDTLLKLGEGRFINGHAITIIPTARLPNGEFAGPMVSQDISVLRSQLSKASPRAWATERAKALKGISLKNSMLLLLSDGIATDQDETFEKDLNEGRQIFSIRLPVEDIFTISRLKKDMAKNLFVIDRLADAPTKKSVAIEGTNQNTLKRDQITFRQGQHRAEYAVELPAPLLRRIADLKLRLPNGIFAGPGAVHMFDEQQGRHPVGLITRSAEQDDLNTPGFYLRQALPLVSSMQAYPLATLLRQKLSVIVWPSTIALSGEDRQHLADWVRRGGWLVRFAHAMPNDDAVKPDQGNDPLLPVKLIGNVRDLSGVMSWEKPQTLAAFAPDTPFYGLSVPPDLLIRKTILAQPDANLSRKTLARLKDGTPLVTAEDLGQGKLLLFHVDSRPEWSNLPLTGLFPDMLERIIQRSSNINASGTLDTLAPLKVLDDNGQLQAPLETTRPITLKRLTSLPPDATHPPGLYGPPHEGKAYNLGPFLDGLTPMKSIGKQLNPADLRSSHDEGPILVVTGLLLLLLDSFLRLRGKKMISAMMTLLIMLIPDHAMHAADMASKASEAARETKLAYVITGNIETDAISEQGLRGISNYASDRTSAKMGAPDGVMPGRDDLAPYPLIYWPVSDQTGYDKARNESLDSFIAHGGMLLIDVVTEPKDESFTRDQNILAQVTKGIRLPPLVKLDAKHILAHCFYILHSFPGRVAGRPVWVARDEEQDSDSVSPVIIGYADWARAWAVDDMGNHPFAVFPGDDHQRQMAERFGVNIIIYALTGNYKRDQLKVPELLKRLQP